jgi:hypothetical protein
VVVCAVIFVIFMIGGAYPIFNFQRAGCALPLRASRQFLSYQFFILYMRFADFFSATLLFFCKKKGVGVHSPFFLQFRFGCCRPSAPFPQSVKRKALQPDFATEAGENTAIKFLSSFTYYHI